MPAEAVSLRLAAAASNRPAPLADYVRALPGAALVLDAAGQVLAANAPAERLVREHPAFRRGSATLSFRRTADQEALQRTLAEAEAGGGSHSVCLHARIGAPVLLLRLARLPGPGPARLLLAIADLQRTPSLPASLMRELGLTPAQARSASLLAAGLGNTEIAQRLGLQPETVRSHLKQAMARLDQHSQLQLAILLNRVADGLDGLPQDALGQPED